MQYLPRSDTTTNKTKHHKQQLQNNKPNNQNQNQPYRDQQTKNHITGSSRTTYRTEENKPTINKKQQQVSVAKAD